MSGRPFNGQREAAPPPQAQGASIRRQLRDLRAHSGALHSQRPGAGGWIDHYHGAVQVSRFAGGAWGAPATIGKGTAWAAFQEVMGLDAGSDTVAAAIWKNAKTGTQTMASMFSG